jgi:fatty-acid desaturase
VLIGLISNGEGWHNNHHAQPAAAAHGHKWWEFDLTYLTIQGLQLVGLAAKVVPLRPPPPGRLVTNRQGEN